MNTIYLSNNAQLAEAAAHWQQQTVLGVDTEFIRTDTFYPIPALVQISDGNRAWLVDVLSIDDFAPLTAVLQAPGITKILHAYSEDLEVFDTLLGVLPSPIFDSQFAAALAGYGYGLGYSKLVQATLGVEIAKDQTRSDWLARPLSAEQCHYASLDVLYLPAIYQLLCQQLQQRNRLDWVEQENQRLLQKYLAQKEAIYPLEKITNGWKLPLDAQQGLANLVVGRDALARRYNRPRNAIARDHALLELARRPPSHLAQLSTIDGIKPSAVRQFGKALIELAQQPLNNHAFKALDKPLDRQQTRLFKQLRQAVENVSLSAEVPVELLIRKQEIEDLVRQADQEIIHLPERLTEGWRHTLLVEPILRALTERSPHDDD